jgi:hypothetical protein
MRATLIYAAGDVRVGYQAMNRRESIKVMVQP